MGIYCMKGKLNPDGFVMDFGDVKRVFIQCQLDS